MNMLLVGGQVMAGYMIADYWHSRTPHHLKVTVRQAAHLTVHTVIIGSDIWKQEIGLMRWFMSQNGAVPGYRQVIWKGVTTLEQAKAIRWCAEERSDIAGLVHLKSCSPVSKYELLVLMKDMIDHANVEVEPQAEPSSDRALAVTRLDARYRAPERVRMLEELRDWMGLP